MRLGEALIDLGITDDKIIQSALQQQENSYSDKRLGELLIEQGSVCETDILRAIGHIFKVSVIPVISDEMLDASLIRELPLDWARKHLMLPVRANGETAVLVNDLTDVAARNDLRILLGTEFVPILTTVAEIERCIQQTYFQQDDSARDFINDLNAEVDVSQEDKYHDQDLLRSVDSAPVTKLVNLILLEAVKSRASDIHLEPYEDRLRIRYRIDGILYEQVAPPKNMEAALISRLKVMGHLDIAEKRLPQDGMTRVSIGQRDIDIRISTIPVAEGERIVLRLLNTENILHPLVDLGMPDDTLKELQDILQENRGAVWVTGPTGSGKTTTLYAALQSLDTKRRNVLTIEDPIEYKLNDIGQMAVKPKIGLSFAQGLRHILRQDPDVILVGETRDAETAEIAIRASLTGHLVFSTLHTNDALGAVIRLIDMGIAPYLVAEATKAVMAQRLARTLCPYCKIRTKVDREDINSLGKAGSRLTNKDIFKAKGCEHCNEGYKGRTGIYELLFMTNELRSHIRKGSDTQTLAAYQQKTGQLLMIDHAVEKILDGLTDIHEILRVIGRA